MSHNIREGDTVLVRCKVVPTTQGSTRHLYPGVLLFEGTQPVVASKLDIVEVRHAFQKGDRVRWNTKHFGEVISITPPEIEPPQAWVKEDGNWPLKTVALGHMERIAS